MSPDEQRAVRVIHETLVALPVEDRLTALACSIVADEPNAMHAVADMISFVGMMARLLPPPQRLALVWRMREEMEQINARWN
jgi:hypothetical protein